MLKQITIAVAGEYINIGNEYVQIDGLSIPIDTVVSLSVEPLPE